jgi:hypothetical protein
MMLGQFYFLLYLCLNWLLLSSTFANATIFLSLFNTLANLMQKLGDNEASVFGSCDGCFCIPSTGETCPVERKPSTEFGQLIPVLRSLVLENPFQLGCDPYNEEVVCDTTPPLQVGGACIVELSGARNGTCSPNSTYTISTYPGSFEEAKANGSLYVTHAGACGTCSTLQDLSVYMELGADLSDKSGQCAIRGRRSASDGTQCFRDLGLTESCAVAWYYNTKETGNKCFLLCGPFALLNRPPNGPPPECRLSRCLACDETESGPLFERFAGRQRRNSGLLSNIVRPCTSIVELVHLNPCA